MTFQEVVAGLKKYHTRLWLDCGDIVDPGYCWLWKSATLYSPARKPLALQTGHPDEWQLTPLYNSQDSTLDFEDCEGLNALTDLLFSRIIREMPVTVYPVIRQYGFYRRVWEEVTPADAQIIFRPLARGRNFL